MSNAMRRAGQNDPVKVTNGVEVTYIMDGKKYRATIKRGGDHNTLFQTALEREMRQYRASGISFDELPVEEQRRIMARLHAEYIVISWNEEDFEEKFSREACEATLIEVPEYLTFLMKRSVDADLFRLKKTEELAKN